MENSAHYGGFGYYVIFFNSSFIYLICLGTPKPPLKYKQSRTVHQARSQGAAALPPERVDFLKFIRAFVS